jgi:hypothetical protein
MAQFPTTAPTFTDLNGSITLAANNHAARHNKVHEEVAAIAAKVGIDSSTDPDSLDKKTADLRTDVTALEADVAPLLVDPTTKAYVDSAISTAVGAAKQALYPIGSYYINETDGTNPGTLLGFGTWSAVANRTIVGKGSGTFATAGATGGAETHTLTTAEMPSHTHDFRYPAAGSGGGINDLYGIPYNPTANAGMFTQSGVPPTSGQTRSGNLNTGGGGAHNNMPPFIVAFIWRRTA